MALLHLLFLIFSLAKITQQTDYLEFFENCGIYSTKLEGLGETKVPFIMSDDGGPAWAVIQRRLDGSLNFNRDWKHYAHGFGKLKGEFFLGLSKIQALTNSENYELWIQLIDHSNQSRFAKYDNFIISDEDEGYSIHLGRYSGTAKDGLSPQNGMKFSTYDNDNDDFLSTNCAKYSRGGWWFKKCRESITFLNGPYSDNEHSLFGIHWDGWHSSNYSFPYVHMAIRPLRLE